MVFPTYSSWPTFSGSGSKKHRLSSRPFINDGCRSSHVANHDRFTIFHLRIQRQRSPSQHFVTSSGFIGMVMTLPFLFAILECLSPILVMQFLNIENIMGFFLSVLWLVVQIQTNDANCIFHVSLLSWHSLSILCVTSTAFIHNDRNPMITI